MNKEVMQHMKQFSLTVILLAVLLTAMVMVPIAGASVNDSDHTTLAAYRSSVTWTITPVAGTGGRISPSSAVAVPAGADQTFAIIPGTGYVVADVQVDGRSVGAVTSYTFAAVRKNSVIKAFFKREVSYTISPRAGWGGTISPSTTVTVRMGGCQTFAVAPETGYSISSVLVDGIPVGAVTSYTFVNVRASHTISATFRQYPPAIVPLCKAGTAFDAYMYAQDSPQSAPMVLNCYWNGNGRVFLSGDKAALIGTYADDGFTVDTPSGMQFDAEGRYAHQHAPLELTAGMHKGWNTLTLIIRNYQRLSMSYGASAGFVTDQVPYIIQVNDPSLIPAASQSLTAKTAAIAGTSLPAGTLAVPANVTLSDG
jgi:hypothetical protein